MNRLLCEHAFNFQMQMLSSPPQVKCSKCGLRETVDVAMEYEQSMRDGRLAKQSSEDERKEFWKSSALAFLSTATLAGSGNNSYSVSAALTADKMLEQFDSRFKGK